MSPLPLPQWQTDITLGSIADLSTGNNKKKTEQEPKGKRLMEVNHALKNAVAMGFEIANQDEAGLYLMEFPEISNNFLNICKKLQSLLPEAKGFRVKVSHDREDPTDLSLSIEVLAGEFSEKILDKILAFYDSADFDFLDGDNGWVHISQVI
jgi:hypothetical protein